MTGANDTADVVTTELLDSDLKPILNWNKRQQACLVKVTLNPVLEIDVIENK